MPFTPAHASLVLPLLRLRPQWISASGLVIGSVAPDFEYFFKMSVNSEHSHTVWGILYFDVPVTIVLAFFFHEVVKRNLITNLPAFIQIRMNDLLTLDFKQHFRDYYRVVIISAGIGAFSHIVWDAFTHNDGFFATRLDLYKHVFIPFDGVRYPLFYTLQHISTFVGLTVILGYILFMKPQQGVMVSRPSVSYWLLIVAVYGSVIFLRFYFHKHSLTLGNFVVSSVSAILVGLLVGGWVKFKRA